MVNFRDYTSHSSKLKYLIIERNESSVQTKLLVQTPLTGWYAGPWTLLRISLHITNWTSECKLPSARSSQTWSLQAPYHHYTNITSALLSLGCHVVRGEICWGEIVVFEGEYCHIPGHWEWAEDTLGRSQEVLVAHTFMMQFISRFSPMIEIKIHYKHFVRRDAQRQIQFLHPLVNYLFHYETYIPLEACQLEVPFMRRSFPRLRNTHVLM
ncbi:hypothetical protein HAX54_041349 [Datura stramonium]|uniref:Uncharacterized protein n=1 Tax=Datura stramonium TaxID=4076 RepID=A0ABS8SLE1_DATST|nr:hypothetical protein [Datura stramonium]